MQVWRDHRTLVASRLRDPADSESVAGAFFTIEGLNAYVSAAEKDIDHVDHLTRELVFLPGDVSVVESVREDIEAALATLDKLLG